MKKIFKIFYAIFFILLALVLFKFFIILLAIALLLLWLRTFQMKKEPNQQEFLLGKLPNPRPDGFYRGDVGFKTSWVGKTFNAENLTGINVFEGKKKSFFASIFAHSFENQTVKIEKEKYPFKTYVSNGLFDQHLLVLKIDYNVKSNPFWIKWVLDEIVEVAPNTFLGKAHLRIIPGFPFSVLYFELKR